MLLREKKKKLLLVCFVTEAVTPSVSPETSQSKEDTPLLL